MPTAADCLVPAWFVYFVHYLAVFFLTIFTLFHLYGLVALSLSFKPKFLSLVEGIKVRLKSAQWLNTELGRSGLYNFLENARSHP